jgi:hypothetical protein
MNGRAADKNSGADIEGEPQNACDAQGGRPVSVNLILKFRQG